MKKIKTIILGLFVMSLVNLTACSSAIPSLDSPCNAYGQNCDPKVPINQWDRSATQN